MAEDKIISFNNESEVRTAVDNMVESTTAAQKENQSLFEELVKSLNELDPTLGDFDAFAAMLSLPEDQFAIVAPVALDQLTRAYTNINDTMLIVQTFNAAGIKLEDVTSEFDAIIAAIDAMPDQDGLLSAAKKDFLKSFIAISMNAVISVQGIEKRILDVPVVLKHDAKMPAYAHMTDAGADIFAAEDMDIMPGEHKVLNTGTCIMVPKGYEVQVRGKSGISSKTHLMIKNGVGTIDEFYIGEIGVILLNVDPPIKDITVDDEGRITSILRGEVEHIEKGQKIAQLVLAESPKMHFYEVEELHVPDQARGAQGFGSTGK